MEHAGRARLKSPTSEDSRPGWHGAFAGAGRGWPLADRNLASRSGRLARARRAGPVCTSRVCKRRARRPRRGREARAPSRLLPLDGAPDPCGHDIGNKDHPPRLAYPRLRTVRFSPASLESELEVHTIDGTRIRVTSVAKTVADCFKFRSKVGLEVALEALREVRRTRRASVDELWRCARVDRVVNVMRPYLEVLA